MSSVVWRWLASRATGDDDDEVSGLLRVDTYAGIYLFCILYSLNETRLVYLNCAEAGSST